MLFVSLHLIILIICLLISKVVNCVPKLRQNSGKFKVCAEGAEKLTSCNLLAAQKIGKVYDLPKSLPICVW